MFQVAAVDHWQVDQSHVVGIDGTDRHVAHCHGVTACAEHGGSGSTAIVPAAVVLLPPPPVIERTIAQEARPSESYIATPHLPPRAA